MVCGLSVYNHRTRKLNQDSSVDVLTQTFTSVGRVCPT